MALAQTTLIQRVRRVLGEDPAVQTGSMANASTTTLTVDDTSKFDAGAIIEFQDNGEQVKVKSITNATTAVVYSRGWNGTTAATHAASTVIFVDPQTTYVDITNAIERCIQGLWPKAWKAADDTVTPGTADWYDLDSTALDLISVTQLAGPADGDLAIYGDKNSGLAVRFRKNVPTVYMASGTALQFPNGFAHASNTIYVRFRAVITSDTAGGSYSDLSEGLLAEVVVYGAATKLVAYKEVPLVANRDVSQGDTPLGPQARLTAASWLEEQYRKHLNNLYDELMRTIPPMKKWG